MTESQPRTEQGEKAKRVFSEAVKSTAEKGNTTLGISGNVISVGGLDVGVIYSGDPPFYGVFIQEKQDGYTAVPLYEIGLSYDLPDSDTHKVRKEVEFNNNGRTIKEMVDSSVSILNMQKRKPSSGSGRRAIDTRDFLEQALRSIEETEPTHEDPTDPDISALFDETLFVEKAERHADEGAENMALREEQGDAGFFDMEPGDVMEIARAISMSVSSNQEEKEKAEKIFRKVLDI